MTATSICVCAADDDLRAWVVDELSLMTWIGAIQLDAVNRVGDMRAEERDVVIVGLDSFAPDQLAQLRDRTWTTPTIALGPAPEGAKFERVLGSSATSRELRQALREVLGKLKR